MSAIYRLVIRIHALYKFQSLGGLGGFKDEVDR